jgi:HEAT repeat protein/beta-lactamase regulating signal transducer with metallopeptidase domain
MLQHAVTTTTTGVAAARIDQPRISGPVSGAIAAPRSQGPAEPAISEIALSKSSFAVLTWAVVALVLGVGYAARRLILVGRLDDRRPVPDGPFSDMLLQLAHDARVHPTPLLTSTSRISSPIALGVREICVPDTALTELDAEQQRSLLAHELAHLARRDPLWLGVANVIERIFWIQPLNRIASRHIATTAEFLCDDWAVHRTGSSVPLASCLAQVAEWIHASPLGVPVAGMAEERSLLVSRVARLLEGVKPTNRSTRGIAAVGVAVLIAIVVVAPGVSAKTRNMFVSGELQRPDVPKANVVEEKASLTASPTSGAQIPDARKSVARQDTNTDSGVVVALIARLDDESADVRRAAAHSLGQLKDSRAVPALIGALKDTDAGVRASVAEALAEFEDVRAIVPLTTLLSDQSTEVRKNAIEALSHFESNVPPAAVVRLFNDPDADVRQEAAHLAGKLHDRSATGGLAKLLGDQSPDVRQAAIEAIAELGDPAAAVALMPALSDASANVREQALGAIEDLKAPITEGTLVSMMRDRDSDVRQRAAHLAGERSVIGAIPTLRQMLEDPNGDVRESAVEALGNIADAAAYDALRSALNSKDAKVRRAAAEALGDRRP